MASRNIRAVVTKSSAKEIQKALAQLKSALDLGWKLDAIDMAEDSSGVSTLRIKLKR